MAVIGLHGIPGSGKTLSSVGAIALKRYKKDNRLIKRIIRKGLKVPTRINTIYANFPILLDKKRNIYCNVISIDDCKNQYSLLPNATIIIDEVQAFYDSYKDFKKFPKSLASFYQFHRHFDIRDVILVSQSPKRIVTYLRDVISEYQRVKRYIKIPFIHLGIIIYRRCYEFDNYYMSFTKNKEQKNMYDIKTGFYLFNYKKAYKSYKSKYLKPFNINKPLINKGTYKSLEIPIDEVRYLNERFFDNAM